MASRAPQGFRRLQRHRLDCRESSLSWKVKREDSSVFRPRDTIQSVECLHNRDKALTRLYAQFCIKQTQWYVSEDPAPRRRRVRRFKLILRYLVNLRPTWGHRRMFKKKKSKPHVFPAPFQNILAYYRPAPKTFNCLGKQSLFDLLFAIDYGPDSMKLHGNFLSGEDANGFLLAKKILLPPNTLTSVVWKLAYSFSCS